MKVAVGKLFAWRPKLEQTIVDIVEGRLSYATGQPIQVSHLDSPRGAWYIIDGHHRAVEAVLAGHPSILVEVDQHVPYIERTGGAYSSYMADKLNVCDFLQRSRN